MGSPGLELKVACREPSDTFGHQIIWNNSQIRINKKTIFQKELCDRGVVYVGDLFGRNGNS